MTKFVHELLLHVVVVVARVMLWMGVLVVLVVLMVLSARVLVVGGLCSFLWFRFGRLRSPSGPDPVAGQPHVSCQGLGSRRAVSLMRSVLPSGGRDNLTLCMYGV